MLKKAACFFVLVFLTAFLILSTLGAVCFNTARPVNERKLKMEVPKAREIKITAVEETLSPTNDHPVQAKAVKRQPEERKTKDLATRPPNKPESPVRKSPAPITEKQDVSKQKEAGPGPSPLSPARYRLDKLMIEAGLQLIKRSSSVPVVHASYEMIGFEWYLSKMLELGGRFFLGDAKGQSILAEIILAKRSGKHYFSGLDGGRTDELTGLALFRPREISGEPIVNEILNYSLESFKESDLRCVILLPINTEAAVLGALEEYFKNRGHQISQFDTVWGRYLREGDQLSLKVEKARSKSTQEIIQIEMVLAM